MTKSEDYKFILENYVNDLYDVLQHRNEKPHLALNAHDTTTITQIDDNTYQIRIEAPIYDKELFKTKGIILYTGDGSYAEELDISGGDTGKHKNYLSESINKANETLQTNCSNNKKIEKVEIRVI